MHLYGFKENYKSRCCLLDAYLGKFGVKFDEDSTILKGTPSGVASIIVDRNSGGNMIIVPPGANYKLTNEDLIRKAITESCLHLKWFVN
jgi:sugar/nucleoside kinase (ribokinase family)